MKRHKFLSILDARIFENITQEPGFRQFESGRFWAWTPAPGDHYRDSFFVRARWPVRPEDVLKVDCDEDGVGGDDAADALRYLVATRARTVSQRKLRGV